MGHEEISGRLEAYLDGEVSEREREWIASHLGECERCAGVAAELSAVSRAVRGSALGRIEVDASFLERLHDRVEGLTQRGLERFAWALSAVAACLAIVGTLQLMQPVSASPVAVVPAAWEGTAVQLSNNTEDASATANAGDPAMTDWMVADLSEGNGTR